MSRILCVGIATLDILHHVDHYPHEDEELRAHAQETRRGGNAANSACVLSQFDHQISLLCTLGDDAGAAMICDDLQQHGIDLAQIVTIKGGHTPTSYITLNQHNGSRTIIHYRDLPELQATAFPWQQVEQYDWFHFEGRNIDAIEMMLHDLKQQRVDQPISLEIEKARPGIERLYPLADILLFSRAFALNAGYTCADELFDALQPQLPSRVLVCSWGEQGAWACDNDGQRYHAPACRPGTAIDTLGAGDTFNAGLINAMLDGQPLGPALHSACELAGRKVTQRGFMNLNTEKRS